MTKMKMLVSISVALALLLALVPTMALAAEDTAGGSFTLGNAAPENVTVALWDTAGPAAATAMDPQVEYNVKVTVTDSNKLDDLDTVTVTIYYDADGDYSTGSPPGAGNVQTAAILTWTNATPNTWTIDAVSGAGSWSIVSGSCVEPTLTDPTGTFEFHFIPGKVATETDATSRWHIYAVAEDAAAATSDGYQEDRTMNWYGEVTVVAGGPVTFPAMSLGDTGIQCTGAVSVTYIANGDYNQDIKTDSGTPAENWWIGVNPSNTVTLREADTSPAAGEMVLQADDTAVLGTAVQVLESSYTTFDTGTITLEAGNQETNHNLWLSLGASGIVADTYSGTIHYQISNG